jgi:apolipoprotein N-acyltransferase
LRSLIPRFPSFAGQRLSWILPSGCTALWWILAYPPFDQGWMAWVAFVPWILFLKEASGKEAIGSGFWVGFLFFLGTIWWLGHVSVMGMLLLAGILAVSIAIWGGWARWILKIGSNTKALVGLPSGWCLLEYIRSWIFSGFGWNPIGHTQWNWIPIIQMADATGVYGVSFLVVGINTGLSLFLEGDPPRPRPFQVRIKPLIVVAIWMGLALLYGTLQLKPDKARAEDRHAFTVALLQGNIPMEVYHHLDDVHREVVWQRYEQLMDQAILFKPDLIIWPESAVPGYMEESAIMERLTQIVRRSSVPCLVGVPRWDGNNGRTFNSAVLLDAHGNIRQRYDKIHLVPFGEFLPFEPLLGWLRSLLPPIGEFSPGESFEVFHWPHPRLSAGQTVHPFSVLICFEDIFPGLARSFVRSGARWLVVITNDGWFGRSAASIQHMQASVFRAVENRVWVVRAANTGWTGCIDPWGRRLPFPAQIPRFRAGTAYAQIAFPIASDGDNPRALTFYTQWGDLFMGLCLILAGWASFPTKGAL